MYILTVESSAPRHNNTAIHSPPNTDIQQGSSQHTADTHRSHSRISKAQSSSTSSRRGTSFPTQRNTLLSWMKPLTSVDSNPTSPTSRPSPSIAISTPTPSDFHQPAGSVEALPPVPSREPPLGQSPQLAVQQAPRSAQSAYIANPSPGQLESTSSKLAKQLRKFRCCTHEQHTEADRQREEHHRRRGVHSECSSIPDITSIVKGLHNGGTPLPDVLKSPRLMRATDIQGVGYKAAFEGTASARLDEATPHNDGLPPSLCLSKKHATSRKNRQPRVSFDIDSTCCFPQSLGFARRGIEWFPKAHPVLNLTGDIHFGLKVPGSTIEDNPSLRYVPLHKISHYSFGRVVGMSDLLMFFFFPALHKESDHEHTSYLSKRDEQLWLDGILLPVSPSLLSLPTYC